MPKYTLEQLTQERNLDQKAFSRTPELISLQSPIEDHVKWAFNHIYSVPYPDGGASNHTYSILYQDEKIKNVAARMHHGIQHVTRAAMYVPVIANLYRKYGDKAALALTEEKLKLLQIAVLFHDSARLNEDKDLWDVQSGDLLYYYLTEVLNVSKDEAKELADAVANKDRESASEKNIYEKIIHDADCLEIVRARPHFDAHYLDFYNDYAEDNNAAFAEMAQLIREVRSIIEVQKDSYRRVLDNEKKYFETADAYLRIKDTLIKEDKKEDKKAEEKKSLPNVLDIIDPRDHYQVIPKLASNLLSIDELKKPLLKDYTPKSRHIFFRGIGDPSAIRKKEIKFPQTEETRPLESMASVELRKSFRKKGVRTRTSKKDALDKDGNRLRSISIEGSFTAAGYFGELDFSLLDEAHATDKGTGRFKKSTFKMQNPLSLEEKKKQVAELNQLLDMGGSSVKFDKAISTHTELIYHIKPDSFKGVYFTQDPALFHKDVSSESQKTYYAKHRISPILQAIFLQKENEKYTGKTLPLYEYSSIHNYFVEKTYSNDDIVAMWREMCVAYIQEAYKDKKDNLIIGQSLDNLKIKSMYFIKEKNDAYFAGHFPGDANYDNDLKHKINQALEVTRKELEEKHCAVLKNEILEIIKSKLDALLEEPYVNYLVNYPILLDNKIIKQSVKNILNSKNTNEIIKNSFSKVLGENNWNSQDDRDWEALERIYLLSKNTGHSHTSKIKEEIFNNFKTSLDADAAKNPDYNTIYYLELAKKFDFINDASNLIYDAYSKRIDIEDFKEFLLVVIELHKNKILDKSLMKHLSDILLKKLLSDTYSIKDLCYFCELIAIFEEYGISLEKHTSSLQKTLSAPDMKIHINKFEQILMSSRNDIELFALILNKFDWKKSIKNSSFNALKEKINKKSQKSLGKYFTEAHQEMLDRFFMDYLLKETIPSLVITANSYPQVDEDQTIFTTLKNNIKNDIDHYILNDAIYFKLMEAIKSSIDFPHKEELLDFVDDFRKKYQEKNVTEFKELPKELEQKVEDTEIISQIPTKSLYQCRRQLEKLKEEKNANLELIKDIFDNTVLKIAGHESLKLPHINSLYDLEQFLQCSKLLNEYKNLISIDVQKQVIVAFFQSYPNKKILDLPDKKLGVSLLSYADLYKDDPDFLKILINSQSFSSRGNKISKYYNIISDHLRSHFTSQHKRVLEDALSDYAIKMINRVYTRESPLLTDAEIFANRHKFIENMDTFILKDEIYQLLVDKTNTFTTVHKQKELLQLINSLKNKMQRKARKLEIKELQEKKLEKEQENQPENKLEEQPEKQTADMVNVTLLAESKVQSPTSKENDNKPESSQILKDYFLFSHTDLISPSNITLFLDEKDSLILKFDNEEDSKSFAQEVKGTIPPGDRKGQQFDQNKNGEIPVRLNEHCLSFPSHQSKTNELAINLVTPHVRDAFIKKLNIDKITKKTFNDGQIGITYWGINKDKKSIPFFIIYNNSTENTTIYFDKARFKKENECIKIQNGQMTLDENTLTVSIKKKY